jgi:hypothetical protein
VRHASRAAAQPARPGRHRSLQPARPSGDGGGARGAGLGGGRQFQVETPDGRTVVVTVPQGVAAGKRITVQLPPKAEAKAEAAAEAARLAAAEGAAEGSAAFKREDFLAAEAAWSRALAGLDAAAAAGGAQVMTSSSHRTVLHRIAPHRTASRRIAPHLGGAAARARPSRSRC